MYQPAHGDGHAQPPCGAGLAIALLVMLLLITGVLMWNVHPHPIAGPCQHRLRRVYDDADNEYLEEYDAPVAKPAPKPAAVAKPKAAPKPPPKPVVRPRMGGTSATAAGTLTPAGQNTVHHAISRILERRKTAARVEEFNNPDVKAIRRPKHVG